MSSNDCLHDQLHNYHSFSLSLIDFLQKLLIQLEKATLDYSLQLKTLEKKSRKLFSPPNRTNPLAEHVLHAFHSFLQTIEDEFHQFDQRRKLIHLIELNTKTLHQQIHSSDLRKEKELVHKYHNRLSHGSPSSRTEYLRKYHQMSSIWKDHLDIIGSQTTNLLWRLYSYSPVKKIHPTMEMGSGDQITPSSNNACIQSSSTSTEIDETRIEPNEHSNQHIDADEEQQWLNLVKQNARHIDDRSLHLSDLSYSSSSSSSTDGSSSSK